MSDPAPTPPPAPPAPLLVPPAPIPPANEPQTFSLEYVRELRSENKEWRQKAQGHETEAQRQKGLAEAAATEATTKITAAAAAAQDRIIRAELKAVAVKAGMVDLDGLKLLDLSTIKLNDAGEVEGAEALLTAAKTAKPWLFGAPPTSTSSPAPVPPVVPPATKKASEMTDVEYRAARKHIERTGRAPT